MLKNVLIAILLIGGIAGLAYVGMVLYVSIALARLGYGKWLLTDE